MFPVLESSSIPEPLEIVCEKIHTHRKRKKNTHSIFANHQKYVLARSAAERIENAYLFLVFSFSGNHVCMLAYVFLRMCF